MHKINLKNIIILIIFLLVSSASYAIDDEDKPIERLVGALNYEEVLNKAKEHSYDLKIADFETQIAKQMVRGAYSEYYPKLNVGLGTEYTKNFRDSDVTVMTIGDNFINPYTRYQSVLGITLSYNVFDFGIRGDNVKMMKEDVGVKELKELQAMQELTLAIIDSYTRVLLTTKQIKQNEEIIKLEKKNLEYKTRLYKAKEISKTLLNDSKIKVATTENKLNELKSARAEALQQLSFYTGEEYDAKKLKISEIEKPEFDIMAFNDCSKSLVWKIHQKEIRKKEIELKMVKKTNFPKITAYSRYNMYGSNESSYPKSLKDFSASNFTVGGSINIPVFDGFRNSANIKKTKLELQQLEVERDKAAAELMMRLSIMRTNLAYLSEQMDKNTEIIQELGDKEKSIKKLRSKKEATPIDENDARVELIQQEIEFEKNRLTSIAITKGIEILTKTDDK